MTDTPNSENRSLSRGREVVHSTGRGGIGNIKRSQSREPRQFDGPDDFSPTRGREPTLHPDRVYSTGRGGAGNIRSPSREGARLPGDGPARAVYGDVIAESAYEQRIVREHAAAEGVFSSGRGGAGNITRSRSRSRGPAVALHSTGRGGVGNIQHGDGRSSGDVIRDQEERRRHPHLEGIHSTGRGGRANLTGVHGPDIEHVHHHLGEYESSGRGGAGNIRSLSGSRTPGSRDASRDRQGTGEGEKHGIAGLWNKMAHHNQPRPGHDEHA
ncbi:hypothetical protein ID866_8417 [Astraeus odoratus]|nr:hypothetical protein ID866_8417 [Astraeus odoratus]